MTIRWYDRLIYRLFFWRWNRILWENDDIRHKFLARLMMFESMRAGPGSTVNATIESTCAVRFSTMEFPRN